MKKKIYALMAFFLAFVGNVMAWEPVIKETHWFGVYEYEGYEYGFGDVHDDHNWPGKTINWSGNYLESIIVVKSATGQDPHQRPKTSFYSWLDHQLRFRVNATGNWSLEKNGHGTYNGLGLYNNSNSGTCFWICNLKKGDQFNVEYYREPGNNASTFLAAQEGALTRVKNGDNYVIAESSYSGNSGHRLPQHFLWFYLGFGSSRHLVTKCQVSVTCRNYTYKKR